MAKSCNTTVLDQALNYFKTNAHRIAVCKAQPTTKTLACQINTGGYCLAWTSLTTANYTLSTGDVSGRKVTIAQKASVSVACTGTATHVAIFSVAGNSLLYVTTCTTQVLTKGNTVTVPAWKIELRDAT
jgi:hypothetical protein